MSDRGAKAIVEAISKSESGYDKNGVFQHNRPEADVWIVTSVGCVCAFGERQPAHCIGV